MAYTRIHNITKTLQKALDYVENPEKTEHEMLVSGYNVDPRMASLEFAMTATLAASVNGPHAVTNGEKNLAYHMIQSFAPWDNVTPEEAHEIGKQWADEILQGKYEYVISTHVDKGHVHNHVIFNAVSFIDFKKFNNYKVAAQLRKVSDRLCEEHGLYVIKNPDLSRRSMSHNEWDHIRRGNSWKAQMKEAIDRAILAANDYASFKRELEKDGIEILEGVRITFHKIGVVSRNGRAAKCRGDRIGEAYTKERILERLAAPKENRAAEHQRNAPERVAGGVDEETLERRLAWRLRKEKIAATKDLAEALVTLRTEQVLREEDFSARVNELSERVDGVRNEIEKISEKSRQYKSAAKYLLALQKYSSVKEEYERIPAGKKKLEFAGRYASELQSYEHAEKQLEEVGVNPSVDPRKVIELIKNQDGKAAQLSAELKNVTGRIARLKKAQQLLDSVKNAGPETRKDIRQDQQKR